jgi:hypothetical protein
MRNELEVRVSASDQQWINDFKECYILATEWLVWFPEDVSAELQKYIPRSVAAGWPYSQINLGEIFNLVQQEQQQDPKFFEREIPRLLQFYVDNAWRFGGEANDLYNAQLRARAVLESVSQDERWSSYTLEPLMEVFDYLHRHSQLSNPAQQNMISVLLARTYQWLILAKHLKPEEWVEGAYAVAHSRNKKYESLIQEAQVLESPFKVLGIRR